MKIFIVWPILFAIFFFFIYIFFLKEKKKNFKTFLRKFLIFLTNFNVTVNFLNKILKTCVVLKAMNKIENRDDLMNNIIITEIGVISCLHVLVILCVYSYLSY